MSARGRGAWVAAVAVAAALLIAAAGAGCGASGGAAQAEGGSDASADGNCPATLSQAHGVACTDEGHVCPVMLQCGVTFELVQCACHSSRWRCEDPVGPLDAADAPRCVDPEPTSKVPCPKSLHDGQGTACDDFGRQCFYEGDVCDSGITLLDYCSCARGDAGGLAYSCSRLTCSPPIEVHH